MKSYSILGLRARVASRIPGLVRSSHRWTALLSLGLCLAGATMAAADAPAGDPLPEPVPLTRDAMKRALDASKESTPRLPLPPVTEEEQALIKEQQQAAASGEKPRRFGLANNGRMRAHYLSDYGFSNASSVERARAGTDRPADGGFDRSFRTMIFWIVSRGNNCTYCLGHQEAGLASRGVSDDELAALDGDWAEFDPARQAAFQFASKLSFEPYAISDADFDALRKHYDDEQIAQIVLAVAGFNATNRWTGPLRIKQDVTFQYTRPTSPKYASLASRVAPLDAATANDDTCSPVARSRPPLESRAEVQAALESARQRAPRLKLADEAATREVLGAEGSSPVDAGWVRLLAAVPGAGAERIAAYQAVLDKGTLDPRNKAIIAYVGARHDHAWYALGHAIRRLKELGFSHDEIFALDRPETLPSESDRAVVEFARKITTDPAMITDADFERMRALFSDKLVAEIVYQTTQAAFFDRLTEAAGLQLEDGTASVADGLADATATAPRPVPVTRPEMKRLIEDMKGRAPRIPLPELTADEKAQAQADPRAFGYEGRLRALYLPGGDSRGFSFGGSRPGGNSPSGGNQGGTSRSAETDPNITLDYAFKTRLFWIASRANNCQYCLGHQESKLLGAGMTEDEIAALDCDWSAFSPSEQAAFALARRLTLEPHLLTDADIDRCREHYTDLQILEMVMSLCGNNSINRWKEGTGVPQSQGGGNFGRRTEGAAANTPAPEACEAHRTYLTPTSDRFLAAPTQVGAVYLDDLTGQVAVATECRRPPLESAEFVAEKLSDCATRSPRLPLVDEDAARAALGDSAPEGPLPNWMRLLANFPVASQRTVASIRAAEELGDLSPLLKAQISWVIARQDRAWYALAEARRRLVALGQTDEQINALDGDQAELSESDRAILTLARNLAASPVVLTDEQVARAVELAGPRDVTQTIHYTTVRASFDRFTEAAGLPVE
jgi:AhpD family alkylhydroperoxidase